MFSDNTPEKREYADETIIYLTEQVYNVKFIIFNNIIIQDINNIYEIKKKIPELLVTVGKVTANNSTKYIMLLYSNHSHYDLIAYNGNTMFTFKDLPNVIKCLVKDRFADFTPDFSKFNNCPKS